MPLLGFSVFMGVSISLWVLWVWVRTRFCLQISVFICRNVYWNSIYDYADFNALEEMNPSLISASRDLGASSAETFRRVIFPLPKRCEKWRSSCLYSFALALYVNAFNWRQSGDYVGNGDWGTLLSNAKLGHGFNNRCDFNCCHVYCDVADGWEEERAWQIMQKKKFKWSYVYLFVVFALLYAPIFYLIFIRLTTRKRWISLLVLR